MEPLPFSPYTNRILHAIPVLRRFEQTQLFKFQDKAADRRVGGVPEVLFQLLDGKLRVAVSAFRSCTHGCADSKSPRAAAVQQSEDFGLLVSALSLLVNDQLRVFPFSS